MARIGINALALDPARTGGAETYIRKLVCCPVFKQQLTKHSVTVFCGTPADPQIEQSGFQIVKCPVDSAQRNKRILWEQLHLPRLLREQQLDLVHFPYSSSCFSYRKTSVVTVHDTTNFVMPESVCLTERLYRKILQSAAARNPACHMIAVSETDRAILQQHMKLSPGRTSVVYHGAPDEFKTAPDNSGTPRPGAPLLWIGRPYYHKNVELLIKMMAVLKSMLNDDTPQLQLIGLDEASTKSLDALARQLAVSSLVSLSGPVPHARLPSIMQNTGILVFPSLYESFGLPPLEAMYSGAPVVCSDLPILREILGDAALYADPQNHQTFAAHCADLIRNVNKWQEHARRGYARAQEFTWEKCAQNTVAIFEQQLAEQKK